MKHQQIHPENIRPTKTFTAHIVLIVFSSETERSFPAHSHVNTELTAVIKRLDQQPRDHLTPQEYNKNTLVGDAQVKVDVTQSKQHKE